MQHNNIRCSKTTASAWSRTQRCQLAGGGTLLETHLRTKGKLILSLGACSVICRLIATSLVVTVRRNWEPQLFRPTTILHFIKYDTKTLILIMSANSNLNMTRQRATLACEMCRSRRTKCDGRRPACSFCEGHGIQCTYRIAAPPVPSK